MKLIMRRRQFIQNSAIFSCGLLAFPTIASEIQETDLVTLKGTQPTQMLEKGLEALGGLERFIQKGQKVLIKPDIGWDRSPEYGANTNPELLGRLVEMCYEVGAREVHVVDHTHDDWTKCYKNSGIERAVKNADAKIFPGNKKFLYQQIDIPEAIKLKQAWVHQEILKTDIIINVPALKADDKTTISGSIRNLMGLIWNWEDIDRLGIDQCLVDLLHFRKPVLNIIDADRVITKNGPTGNSPDDISLFKSLILSPDIVAADSAAAALLNIDPTLINHITLANKSGFGDIKVNESRIRNIQF